MNRKLYIITSCLTVVKAIFPETSAAADQGRKSRVNVLFLLADDQRADAIACSGNNYIRTPGIDQLASTGVRFTNSYIMGSHSAAISAPSRAMLLSGKYLNHVYDRLDGVETMPAYFHKNGYQTFATGKWHNEPSAFEASFQEGENVFVGGMCNHYRVPCQRLVNGMLTSSDTLGYSTDLFADAAIRFLESYAEKKPAAPFFCYVAFTAPHDPRSPRQDYIGLYPDGTIPPPGNFKTLHPFRFDNMNVRDETLAPWPRTPEIIQQSLSDYYTLITHLDKRVGDIISTLKAKGLYDNTIIVYAADNGLAIGSHGLLGKQNLYEHSVKVPLIISGPGVPRAQVRQAMVYLCDLFPTLANLCHLPVPKQVDGKCLTPVICGKSDAVRKSLFTAYRNTVRAVRTDEWKMIVYPQQNYIQLFNLKKDPLEMNNLSGDSANKGIVTKMTGLLKTWLKETGDTLDLFPKKILPMEYDYRKLKQIPDAHQPDYILKRYFKNVDFSKIRNNDKEVNILPVKTKNNQIKNLSE